MKTTIKITLAISVLLAASCAKSEIQENDTINNNPDIIPSKAVTLKAYADESLLTKSNYTLSGDEYLFEWVANDKFIVQTYDGTSTYSSDVFTASEGGKPKVEFTGSIADGYDKATYAFYPNDGTAGTYNFKYKNVAISPVEPSSTDEYGKGFSATISLPLNVVEDKDHPWAHIPMIGVKDSNGDYSFAPATGVIKLTINALPESATRIRMKTTKGYNAFSGDFVFDTANEIRLNYGASGAEGDLILVISPATGTTNRSFYFPVPTGTLGAGTFAFSVENDGFWWRQGSPKVDLSVVKGQVLELPPVTYHETRTVEVTGTATNPVLSCNFPEGEKIYFSITDSETTPDSYDASLGYAQNYTITQQFLPLTSGTMYLHYKIVQKNNESTVYASDKVPFTYSIEIPGTYSAGSGYTFTIANSDDALKGDFMITAASKPIALSGKIYGTINGRTIVFSGTQFFDKGSDDSYYCIHGQGRDGIVRDIIFSRPNNTDGVKFTPTGAFGVGKVETWTSGVGSSVASYTTTGAVWNSVTLTKQ